jgi:hypothetical protein
MGKGRVILPWVLGSMIMVCAAVAMMVSVTRPAPEIPAQTARPATPPASVQAAVPAALPTGAPDLAAAPGPAAAPDPAAAPEAAAPQATQIWECKTNGQRTFSDKPCGDKPMLREISALNIMNPTPVFPVGHSYEPEPRYAVEYSDPGVQEPTEGAYPVVVGYPVLGYPYYNRRRPDHTHRPPHPQHHGPTPRKIQ